MKPGAVLIDDMRGDVDGLGAAGMLAVSGRPVYGLISSTNARASAETMAAIDKHYGLGARIGIDRRGTDPAARDPFSSNIAREFPTGRRSRIVGAVKAFRQALRDAKRDGNTVDVISTGSHSTLARMLNSRKARRLIRDVVTGTTIMGGSESGEPEYNIRLSPAGANRIARKWPGPVRWLPFEQGRDILTGGVLADRPGPVRRGYQLYPSAGGTGKVGDTRSWDKVAVAHFLRPGHFNLSPEVQPSFSSDARSSWRQMRQTGQRLLQVKGPGRTARFINKLLKRT